MAASRMCLVLVVVLCALPHLASTAPATANGATSFLFTHYSTVFPLFRFGALYSNAVDVFFSSCRGSVRPSTRHGGSRVRVVHGGLGSSRGRRGPHGRRSSLRLQEAPALAAASRREACQCECFRGEPGLCRPTGAGRRRRRRRRFIHTWKRQHQQQPGCRQPCRPV